jgi:hypothetical protein
MQQAFFYKNNPLTKFPDGSYALETPAKGMNILYQSSVDNLFYSMDSNRVSTLIGGGSSTGGYSKVNYFTPTLGQTIFIISEAIASGSNPLLQVNGQEQRRGVDYNVASNTIVFLNSEFSLSPTDQLDFYFN